MKNKLKQTLALACSLTCSLVAVAQVSDAGYPIRPVPFTSVKVQPGFWGSRLQASREVTIPLAFQKCEENNRVENFVRAAHPNEAYEVDKVEPFPFDDTDVYKTIEGASYSMQTYPNARMDAYIDSVLAIVAKAQEPDGYLYTARTMNPAHPQSWSGSKRWEKVEVLSHEFYNLGHMLEAAVAHYQATGKRNFLDIAIKYADCVCREIGPGCNQLIRVPGHQIAEMGLAKLYLATGNKKYLEQAKFFLDQRGHTSIHDLYSQSHIPVLQQKEAVGHAVRAVYMYAGMADVAALTGDTAYVHAIDRIWENIVSKKYYVTGGIGARHQGEAFGDNYELPNLTAYCETCAQIGFVYVNHRLFLLHGDSKYYDVLERTLYNGLISGDSMDGGSFFYPNPLASDGGYSRKAWFGCACCPSNLSRFIPSLPGYVYAQKQDAVYVNLFMNNETQLTVNGKKISLKQTTEYPWEGDIAIRLTKGSAPFALKIRIPGWVQGQPVPSDLYRYADSEQLGYSVQVNGVPVQATLQQGYFTINRKWKKGDEVRVHFDMKPRTVVAHQKVQEDAGCLAVERGPLVYCAEWPDQSKDIRSLKLLQHPTWQVDNRPELLNGVRVICTKDAEQLSTDAAGHVHVSPASLTLIPYYAWAHRGEGVMRVWLPQTVSKVLPTAE